MYKILAVAFLLISPIAKASDLKVFGSEFCNPYDAHTCINFHYEKIKNAKSFLGSYKYPKGRQAYDECASRSPGSDGALAHCAMLFHYAEQSTDERREMCGASTRARYIEVTRNQYALYLYDSVWSCSSGGK